MTKLLSLLPEPRRYSSTIEFEPPSWPGMRVWIRRMSLGRRIELARQVRDLAGKLEYHEASEKVADRVEAALIGAEIDAAYLRWGVLGVEGFEIDGVAATAEDLISAAPEALVREIVARIKRECGLTDAERKN